MKVFGRDPALISMGIVLLVQNFFALVLHVSPGFEGTVIAVAVAGWGVVVAFVVKDGQVAAILGGAKALIALTLAFGLHWSTTNQDMLMNLIVVAVALITRTQVVAPVAAPTPPADTPPVAVAPVPVQVGVAGG